MPQGTFLRDDTLMMMLANDQPIELQVAASDEYTRLCTEAGVAPRPEETHPGDPDIMAKAARAATRLAIAKRLFQPQ